MMIMATITCEAVLINVLTQFTVFDEKLLAQVVT